MTVAIAAPADEPGLRIRSAGSAQLAQALAESRRDTLATFARVHQTLGSELRVPRLPTLNPPLWELGHVGWFQEFWLARFPARHAGAAADPALPRSAPLHDGADALYDSSRVPHPSRWSLPLPDVAQTRLALSRQLDATLELLQRAEASDAGLYFFRLSLLHEDMHHEAALYMARALDMVVDDPRWQPPSLPAPGADLARPAVRHRLGWTGEGFAFDNECGVNAVDLAPYRIAPQVVRWAEYLPFVEAGGYGQPQWWSREGRAWLAERLLQAPRYLRRAGSTWLERHGLGWRELDLTHPARHLSFHEAEAWCRFAGRRLPSEAEWEHAALTRGDDFRWGTAWEWTASPFAPFAGFAPHPYRDYSAPWFDGRPVLRGASHLTQPRMRHPRYRNFFSADRSDIAAGFRSCAL